MKKTLLSICLTAISFTSFAQYNDDAPVTFGVKANANFASLQQSLSGSSGSASTGTLTTFGVGIFADFKIAEQFSIQPALLYAGKGGKESSSFSISEGGETIAMSSSVKTTIYYLHLPVNVLYHVPVGDNTLSFGAGPFVSYGLSGKAKGSQTGTFGGETETIKIDEDASFGNEPGDVKRMDYGVGVLASFKLMGGFAINAGYEFGLANLQPKIEAAEMLNMTPKIKTRVITVGIGYSF